jgi:hypothetical protein
MLSFHCFFKGFPIIPVWIFARPDVHLRVVNVLAAIDQDDVRISIEAAWMRSISEGLWTWKREVFIG